MMWLLFLILPYLFMGVFLAGYAQERLVSMVVLWAFFWPLILLGMAFYRVYLFGRDDF